MLKLIIGIFDMTDLGAEGDLRPGNARAPIGPRAGRRCRTEGGCACRTTPQTPTATAESRHALSCSPSQRLAPAAATDAG